MVTVSLNIPTNLAFGDDQDLRNAITDHLQRDDLVDDYGRFIAMAEERFNRLIWTPDREGISTLAPDVAIEALPERNALPADFWAIRAVKTNGVTMKQMTPHAVFFDSEPGNTCYYSIVGRELVLEPVAAIPQTLTMLYWKQIGPLALQGSNWLLERHPSIYLLGALQYAELRALNPEMASAYQDQMLGLIAELNAYGGMQRYGGGPLKMNIR